MKKFNKMDLTPLTPSEKSILVDNEKLLGADCVVFGLVFNFISSKTLEKCVV